MENMQLTLRKYRSTVYSQSGNALKASKVFIKKVNIEKKNFFSRKHLNKNQTTTRNLQLSTSNQMGLILVIWCFILLVLISIGFELAIEVSSVVRFSDGTEMWEIGPFNVCCLIFSSSVALREIIHLVQDLGSEPQNFYIFHL